MRYVKNSIVLTMFLFNAFLILAIFSLRDARSEDDAPHPSQNGDVNCDEAIDVSDPVFMLNWLFNNGPEPCAFAQEEGLAERVEALEREIELLKNPCVSRVDRFVANGDGTITDQCTGLIWSASPVAIESYDDAQISAQNSTLAGFEDWRLPTADEFVAIILPDSDHWRPNLKMPFENVTVQPMWSSTEGQPDPDDGWRNFYTFHIGRSLLEAKATRDPLNVVLVREPK